MARPKRCGPTTRRWATSTARRGATPCTSPRSSPARTERTPSRRWSACSWTGRACGPACRCSTWAAAPGRLRWRSPGAPARTSPASTSSPATSRAPALGRPRRGFRRARPSWRPMRRPCRSRTHPSITYTQWSRPTMPPTSPASMGNAPGSCARGAASWAPTGCEARPRATPRRRSWPGSSGASPSRSSSLSPCSAGTSRSPVSLPRSWRTCPASVTSGATGRRSTRRPGRGLPGRHARRRPTPCAPSPTELARSPRPARPGPSSSATGAPGSLRRGPLLDEVLPEDLAERALRDLLTELDDLGNLVVGHALLTERDDLALLAAVDGDDRRLDDLLALHLPLHAHHHRLADLGMRLEDVLHLHRVDLVARDLDEQLLATGDEHPALGVDAADVAREVAAVAEGGAADLVRIGVAARDGRPPDGHLAFLARGHRHPGVIHDGELDARDGRSDGRARGHRIRIEVDGHHAGLRGSVELAHGDAVSLMETEEGFAG